MTSDQIRKQFIDFFVERHGHSFVPSSSVVPHDDPTLLFTNAGMNQFKPYFLGTQSAPWRRVANTQKCIRAGGKHNDLDDVGRSRRHGTFFEMLGNWSFGDYFKRGAIEMAWELITKVWSIDPSRLYVTCYEGGDGVPRDDEAAKLWKEVAGLPDDHIHFFGAKDNFWEMGETGPCGPCTEINIDRRADDERRRTPPDVNGDDPRVMEFWNLVFIQYNRNPDRSLTPLPAQHVDTGMGFERISQILQDRDDMYGIDLFDPYWAALTGMTGIQYAGTFPKTNAPDPAAEAASPQLRHDIAFRVIADHIRTLTFALTDGAVPSNEGRGYVLRRILRRAVRFGRQSLELRDPFLHRMVPVVVDSMGAAFPELKKNPQRVVEIVKDEEVSFGRTLERGIRLFDEAAVQAAGRAYGAVFGWNFFSWERTSQVDHEGGLIEGSVTWKLGFDRLEQERKSRFIAVADVVSELATRNAPVGKISSSDAFKLHDTYGFPIDLTQIMAAERGMSVDIEGYEKLMEAAREKARAGGKGGDSPVYDLPAVALAELQRQGIKPTDDEPKFELAPIETRVMAIWNGSNLDPSADPSEDQEVAVILDRTNFYAEMGGQVGDGGVLASASGDFDVETTRLVGGYVLHVGRARSGEIRVGDLVTATVSDTRRPIMQNHTGTHLLNWALRETLGDAVQQKGSLVAPDRLRFDFSHARAMSDAEVERVEDLVTQSISKGLRVYAESVAQESAMKINGLRAVFGEKYPAMVRVVSVGPPVAVLLKDPTSEQWRQYSIEFCGGTHLGNSSDVGALVMTSEESVSKGVRRIVALTGEAATTAAAKVRDLEQALEQARSLPEAQLPQTINALQKRLGAEDLPLRAKRRGQAAVAELQSKLKAWDKSQRVMTSSIDVSATAAGLLASAEEHAGGQIVVAAVEGASDDQLRSIIDSIKKRSGSFAVMLASAADGKVSFVAAVGEELIGKGLKAGDWVREAAKAAGGGGGGRPQMAQAGGKDPAKLPAALEIARKFAADTLLRGA